MSENIPNPGTDEAKQRGCLCPTIDNGWGRGSGRIGPDGKPQFFINESCPLHGTAVTSNRLAKELERWQGIVRPLVDEVSICERLTKDDYAIRINARD